MVPSYTLATLLPALATGPCSQCIVWSSVKQRHSHAVTGPLPGLIVTVPETGKKLWLLTNGQPKCPIWVGDLFPNVCVSSADDESARWVEEDCVAEVGQTLAPATIYCGLIASGCAWWLANLDARPVTGCHLPAYGPKQVYPPQGVSPYGGITTPSHT